MNWPWKKKRVEEPKQVKFASLADVKLTWVAVPASPPMDNTVGSCLFCGKTLVRMDDYFQVTEIGAVGAGYTDILCCSKCAVDRGLKW